MYDFFLPLMSDLNHHTLSTMDTLSKTYLIDSINTVCQSHFSKLKHTFTSTNNSHTTTTKVSMFEQYLVLLLLILPICNYIDVKTLFSERKQNWLIVHLLKNWK